MAIFSVLESLSKSSRRAAELSLHLPALPTTFTDNDCSYQSSLEEDRRWDQQVPISCGKLWRSIVS